MNSIPATPNSPSSELDVTIATTPAVADTIIMHTMSRACVYVPSTSNLTHVDIYGAEKDTAASFKPIADSGGAFDKITLPSLTNGVAVDLPTSIGAVPYIKLIGTFSSGTSETVQVTRSSP
jgi:hypothetical protein